MNTYLIDKILQEQQQEMRRETEKRQLIALWEKNNRRLRKPLLVFVADVLIRLGERIKKHYSQGIECPQG